MSGAGGCPASPRRAVSSGGRRGPADDLAGRTLFVHAEQGLGSAIQFVRYAGLLAAKRGRVLIECQPPLYRLFESSLVEAGWDGCRRSQGGDSTVVRLPRAADEPAASARHDD